MSEAMSCKHDPDFDRLVAILHRFKIYSKAVSEHELENRLVEHLTKHGINFDRQAPTTTNGNSGSSSRYDIVVRMSPSARGAGEKKRYIIELKKTADRSCVDQLDRYAKDCQGLILLCWQASHPLRVVIALEKPRARIPLELVEVRRNMFV